MCRSSHTNLRLGLVQVVLGVNAGRCEPVEEDNHGEEDEHEDCDAAEDRLSVPEVCPLATGLASVALDRLVAELVVNHTTKSDAVSEELQASHLGAPDDHRGSNKENILEDTAEGEHKRGCFANLHAIVRNTMAEVS
jgi:hypothetical protein